jgi:rubredoxin
MEQNDFMAAMQQGTSEKKTTRNTTEINAKFVCPDCGLKMDEKFNDCPHCGCPKEYFMAIDSSVNICPSLESSNDFSAEKVVNSIAKISLIVGILGGIFGLITGFIFIEDSAALGIILIVVGLIFFLFSLVFWALLKLLVNISYRLTRIDNRQK